MDGLPSSMKESVGEYTSAKDLWFKLESEYQKARPEPEKKIRNQKTSPQKRSIEKKTSKKRTPVKVWTLVIVMIACVMKLRRFF